MIHNDRVILYGQSLVQMMIAMALPTLSRSNFTTTLINELRVLLSPAYQKSKKTSLITDIVFHKIKNANHYKYHPPVA